MDQLSVFIVGDSLFAEGIIQSLASWPTVKVVGQAASIEVAWPLLEASTLDALVVVDIEPPTTTDIGAFLAAHPNMTIIRTDLSTNQMQVIASRAIQARSSDLLAAISALAKGRQQR